MHFHEWPSNFSLDRTFVEISLLKIHNEFLQVSVVNNEMTTDALKVVYAKDGSHLLISCNRLLGKPPTPECTWTTSTSTTTTTTTTTTSTTTTTTQKESSTVAYVVNNDDQDSFLGEIIGGVVSGILAIIALILLILFLKQRQKSQQVPQIDQEDPKPIGNVQLYFIL